MSTTRQRDGDLLAVLDPSSKALMDGPRGATPVVGATVTLWRLPGTWSVWSAGPTTGTWWLQPRDDDAERILTRLVAAPARGLPDVTQVYDSPRTRAAAVRTKAIRAGGR
ncbi:hypothetical protein [Cellulomonas sp. RIT-PI-Y]|uniref:hypothetical protein n=1 Tax=Cellulomonas sp. RIT-PI-Y TaxID=3035297 RepID=UPI0021DB20A3|nr:hypothetical protein [Cellulomonas sp. RIT-PI-Y]